MGLKLTASEKQKARNIQAYSTIEEEITLIQNTIQEEPLAVLQGLMSEEANLMKEKKNLNSQLADLREKRRSKLQRNIQRKRKRIKKLRTEIEDVKFSCERLAKSLRYAHTRGTR
jgi:predicted RNase H-like nuclease (RuvC/YqgF family)